MPNKFVVLIKNLKFRYDKGIIKWSKNGEEKGGDVVAEYVKDEGRAKRYREHDENYDSYHILFGEKITKICQSYDKKINVLDLACGTGRYFHRLKNVNKNL